MLCNLTYSNDIIVLQLDNEVGRSTGMQDVSPIEVI